VLLALKHGGRFAFKHVDDLFKIVDTSDFSFGHRTDDVFFVHKNMLKEHKIELT
jgi:hypothetical protein